MKKYPTNKPSGVEWIGEVPEHWEVKKLKRLAKICNGQDHKNVWTEDGEYPIIGTGGEFGRANSFLSNGPSVILGRKGTIDKPQFIEHPFWSVDTAYFTEIYNFTDPKFFYYCCTTIQFDRYKYGSAVPSMTQETLNQIPFATPPLPEQTAIATYLDRKTAQIDQTIAEKERLIELFREERQALINHAVTKGIRPGAKMKDSGVEWIGEVPEGWEVKKLKYVVNLIQTGPFGSQLHSDEYVSGKIPVINPSNIENGKIVPNWDLCIDEEKFTDLQRHRLTEGDIVFGRRGEMGRCGLVSKVEDGWLCGTGSLLVRPNPEKINSLFLNTFLGTLMVKAWLSLNSVGSTMENLNTTILGDIPIVNPSILEQITITAYLDQKTTQIDTAISGIQQEIALLQEYRQALIFEAVTGKIDVREYAQN